MTNTPAADEPAADAAAERAATAPETAGRDTATPATAGAGDTTSSDEETTDTPVEPRFEADYLPEDAPAPAEWPADTRTEAQVAAPTATDGSEPATEPAAAADDEAADEPERDTLVVPATADADTLVVPVGTEPVAEQERETVPVSAEPASAEPEALDGEPAPATWKSDEPAAWQPDPAAYPPPTSAPPAAGPTMPDPTMPYGTPPPPFGAPPPPFGAGAGAPPPPPGGGPGPGFQPPFSGAMFNRSNLVRPQQGRYVAGVCAAIGRATNTDPTLWRVVFAVLTLAGGVSIVAYLLGWLLLPAEGDTSSPLEAVLGKGRSSTSAPLAIVIGVCAVLAFLLVVTRNVGAAAIGLAVVIGLVALLVRGQGGQQQPTPIGPFVPPPAGPPPAPFPPSAPPFPGTPATMQAAGHTTAQAQAPSVPRPPLYPEPTMTAPQPMVAPQQPTVRAPMMSPAKLPSVPPLPPLPPLPFPPGYRPPFAPHGPFRGNSPYAATLGYPPPGGPGAPYPGLAPMPPKPPKPPKERSKLGRLTLSLILLALGVLAVLEVTVADFKVATFFAVPLAVVALGLITGAWLGRARVLILLGALLSIALAIATASTMDNGRPPERVANINLNPITVDDLNNEYSTDIGDIRADLTSVDFVDQNVFLSLTVRYGGNIEVTLPPNVDADVHVRVDGADCHVFDNDCGGFNQANDFHDNGADGPGGGKIELNIDLQYGNVRVTR